ncbi:MAG: phytase, partial [Candidatus Neomarinimicrobiota bacterium]
MKNVAKTQFDNFILLITIFTLILTGCKNQIYTGAIKPAAVTEKVKHDTDDPAIWINSEDPSKSLIIGTDKDDDGALYVFDLEGNIIEEKTV